MGHQRTLPKEPLSIRVRSLYREEFDDALRLIYYSIQELNAGDYAPAQLKSLMSAYRRSVLESGTVIVAEHDSQLVGVAKASLSSFSVQSIEAVFTHPDFVGRGVGHALVLELERQADLRQIKKLSVLSSLTAVGFYQKLAYKRTKNVSILGGVRCVELQKQLRPYTLFDHLSGMLLPLLLVAATLIVLYSLIFLFYVFLLYGG